MANFFENVKKYYPIVLFVALIIVSFFLFQTCSNYNNLKKQTAFQDQLYKQNIRALGDSIKVEFNKKLNALDFSKQSFVVNKFSELERYNAYLYNELSKVKGDIMSAIDSKVKITMPSVTLGNRLEIINKDSNYYGLRFSRVYADSGFSQKISGSSRFYVNLNEKLKSWTIKPDVTILDTNQMTLRILYGTRKKDKGYEVYAISKSPYAKLDELEGAYFVNNQIVPPAKVKNWAIGPYIGFGLNTDYNLANPRFGWSLGFSVHYDVFQWRFGKK